MIKQTDPQGVEYCILKIEVPSVEMRKTLKFAKDTPIGETFKQIRESFREIGVGADEMGENCALYYEPFSAENTALQAFLEERNMSHEQRGEKAHVVPDVQNSSASKSSDSIPRPSEEDKTRRGIRGFFGFGRKKDKKEKSGSQVKRATSTPASPVTPAKEEKVEAPVVPIDITNLPTEDESREEAMKNRRALRSTSLDMGALYALGSGGTSTATGFWLDSSRNFGFYAFPAGTHLYFKPKDMGANKRLSARRIDGAALPYIRVSDVHGTYKTIYADETATMKSLKPELAKKYGVSNYNDWTLFEVMTDNSEREIVEDDHPMKLVIGLSDAETTLKKFVWRSLSGAAPEIKGAVPAAAAGTPDKKDPRVAALKARLEVGRRKGKLDLSYQELPDEMPDSYFSLVNIDQLTINSAGLWKLPPLSHFTNLLELRLVKNKFKEIPPEVLTIPSLRELDMGNNMITSIHSGLVCLTGLKELYLYVNQIGELPEKLEGLGQLAVFNIAHNLVSSIPPDLLQSLPRLGQLKVSSNRLTKLPSNVATLTRLVDINVSRNQLTELPKELGLLSNLRWFNCKENELTEIPIELCNCWHLEEVIVSNNHLKTLPTNFPSVKVFQAASNKIETLPDNIRLDSVVELDLNENNLTSLPSAMFLTMKAVQKLGLAFNRLEALPSSIGDCSRLSQLDIKSNRLLSLPEELGSVPLQVLDCSRNRLSALPSSIWRLSRLWFFHCAGNLMETIPSLPESNIPLISDIFFGDCKLKPEEISKIENLRTLRTLDLGYNNLVSFKINFAKFANLIILYLNGNNLTSLPESVGLLRTLKELHLGNNKLQTLPKDLPLDLVVLDISHNCMRSIEGIENLKQLEWLDVSANPDLQAIPATIGNIATLKVCYFEGCAVKDIPERLQKLVHGSKKFGSRFTISWADMQGKREGMEDSLVIQGNLGGNVGYDMICVLDGHGGSRVAEFAGENLLHILEQDLLQGGNVEEALVSAFRETHRGIQVAEIGVMEGATGVCAVIVDATLYVANVGDTRAVLCRAGKAIRLSFDHKPELKEEEARISALGGFVGDDKRVNAVLAVSRAFGDWALDPYVICEPFTSVTDLNTDDQFVIIACDGVWDVLTDQQAVDLVLQEKDKTASGWILRDYAYMYGSTDNITAVVIHLDNCELPPPPPARSNSDAPPPIRKTVDAAKPTEPAKQETASTDAEKLGTPSTPDPGES